MLNVARNKLQMILESNDCNVCASVFDPLSSRMAESIGFNVGILGGSISSLMQLGVPDISLLTLSELADHARRVCRASTLPVIVDGDSGYGNALNVTRLIQELEFAGAAGVTIEDTVLPKPYGPSHSLASLAEATSKLKAALDARQDESLAVIARTPADSNQSLSSILERVDRYTQVGVDAICAFGLSNPETLAAIKGVTSLPIMIISYGDNRLGNPEVLAAQGVRVYMRGHTPFENAIGTVYQSLIDTYNEQSESASVSHLTSKRIISNFSHQAHFDQLFQAYDI
ncbi:isocitrate lyase/PEP mutase family protein [Marinobacter xiaoshiensis]|uniref:Isocitrate lyase/phosphoenolpyruvate mutase family protein n=1 Tax=Marinobacter xiaoshiensis TaxID=3073652 RepID=A0ABU2HDK1_9GAMM|nr:isocitrate lyase/phosphoenolpyruvate mutase family protein [Marinobacter sp. F60267]MDS1309157.1 isocitrate lyase/phosphoenolpyruvate mutase family protein [Marinobacter sp. F60267]